MEDGEEIGEESFVVTELSGVSTMEDESGETLVVAVVEDKCLVRRGVKRLAEDLLELRDREERGVLEASGCHPPR